MAEIKYSLKRGADRYEGIYHGRLRNWILKGNIARDEALVWRSGLSGWRKPEELEELRPYFEQREKVSGIRRAAEEEEEEEEEEAVPKKLIRNILIIDDEKDLCWLLSNILQSKGYIVSTAHTISDGIARAKEAPDLLFLDLKLPDGDGMELLPRIREITPQTLVIIISAYGSEEKRREAKDRGGYSFIDKPFTEGKILETIRTISREGSAMPW